MTIGSLLLVLQIALQLSQKMNYFSSSINDHHTFLHNPHSEDVFQEQTSSKTVQVTCSVETCKEQVLAQNYERHLKRYHPQEDYKILRTYGQKQISFASNKSQAVVMQKDAIEDRSEVTGDKVMINHED